MSREELDNIQGRLKAAIQKHQIAVVCLRAEPNDEAKQREIREIQSQIASLGEQQKRIILELRKRLNQIKAKKLEENVDETSTPTKSGKAEQVLHTSKQHTPRPSILQSRGSVIRLQNDVAVKSPPPPEGATCDIRRLLSTAAGGQTLTPQQMQKVEYMASLNLVTRARLKELENRRTERRRRSTANPQFSYAHGHQFPESRKRLHNDSSTVVGERKRGRPPLSSYGNQSINKNKSGTSSSPQKTKPAETSLPEPPAATKLSHGPCGVCTNAQSMDARVAMYVCTRCQQMYHATCVHEKNTPTKLQQQPWKCPNCQDQKQDSTATGVEEIDPETRTVAEMYLAAREAEKEKEREKLERKSKILRNSGKRLQERALQLGNLVQQRIDERKTLQQAYAEAQQRVETMQQLFQKVKDS